MEAPAEFTQVSTNYKDLHEDDCMAYTTLDQLDSDFDAGEFMPRIKSALVKVASENAAAMDIEEHHRKTPRGFQLGLIKVSDSNRYFHLNLTFLFKFELAYHFHSL